MQTSTAYIFRQLVVSFLSITIVLTLAIWLAYSLRFVDYIVNRGVPLSTFLYFVVLLLPRFLGFALPIATFCAVLFTYNKLASDSELVVMRSVGLSNLQLGKAAFLLATVVTVGVAVVTLNVAPTAARSFEQLKFMFRNEYASLLIQPGVFRPIEDDLTLFVREQLAPNEYGGILLQDDSNNSNQITYMAERGAILTTDSGPRIVLRNGTRQQLARDTGRVQLLYFDQHTQDLGLGGNEMTAQMQEEDERSLSGLFNADPEEVGERNAMKFAAEGHARIAGLGMTLAMTLAALASILAGRFNRSGYTKRIVVACIGALVIETTVLLLKGIVARETALAWTMYAGVILPSIVGFLILTLPPRQRTRSMAAQARAGGAA